MNRYSVKRIMASVALIILLGFSSLIYRSKGVGNCAYQDHENFTVNGASTTCGNLIEEYGLRFVCENDDFKNWRCKSCRDKAQNSAVSCPYGDYKHVTVNGQSTTCLNLYKRYGRTYLCGHKNYKNWCCETCCENGDKLTFYANHKPYTCASATSKAGGASNLCQNKAMIEMQIWCCQTCKDKIKYPEHKDCLYGDYDGFNFDGEQTSCPKFSEKYGPAGMCQHHAVRRMCCESCRNISRSGVEDCQYGDNKRFKSNGKLFTCPQIFEERGAAHVCQHAGLKQRCCESCRKKATGVAGCLYGDYKEIILNDELTDCPTAIDRYGQASVCGHHNFKQWCCKSCNKAQ